MPAGELTDRPGVPLDSLVTRGNDGIYSFLIIPAYAWHTHFLPCLGPPGLGVRERGFIESSLPALWLLNRARKDA